MRQAHVEAPRELIAFAFVEEEFARSGDIVRGLMPLFAPLLAKSALRRFDPNAFAKAVEQTYDIPMSALVAESLVPQLTDAGLLYTDPQDPHVYRVARFDYKRPEPQEGTALESVLDDFVSFSQDSLKRAGIGLDAGQLKDGLLRRLTNMDFLSFLGKPDRNYFKGRTLGLKREGAPDNDEARNPEQAMDVLCADFATSLSESKPEKFELLSRLSTGALIAEVVLTLQTPSADADLSAVTVILDGPLVLDHLDLSTVELRDYATALFELIDSARLKKAVFQHTLEEMQGTIKAPLDALMRGDLPYGPLGGRIRRSQGDAAYARAMLNDLPQALARLGIEIVDATQYEKPEYKQYCPDDIEDFLRNAYGLGQESFERRHRDAHSIATLLRMRSRVTNPQSLPEAGFVMVTRNTDVATLSRRDLIFRKRINENDLPPALTDRQLAGLLWFAVGGNLGALSKAKLVANCSAVLQPRTDIASKLKQVLYESDPRKVDVFIALMRDQRAQRALVHQTLGFPAAITRDNADMLLEQMRRATAEQVRLEAATREDQLRVTFDERMADLTATHTAETQRLQTELLQLSAANTALTQEREAETRRQQQQLNQLSMTVEQLGDQRRADIDSRIQESVAYATSARTRLRVLVVILYMTLVLAAGLSTSNQLLGTALGVLLAALGFWIVPHWVFDKPLTWIWTRHFHARSRQLHVADELREFDVDAGVGTARRKQA